MWITSCTSLYSLCRKTVRYRLFHNIPFFTRTIPRHFLRLFLYGSLFWGIPAILSIETERGGAPMGRHSDYGNGMYRKIQEIMERLESVEKKLKYEKKEHKEDVCCLNDKIKGMEKRWKIKTARSASLQMKTNG